jgi:hypothetical protein
MRKRRTRDLSRLHVGPTPSLPGGERNETLHSFREVVLQGKRLLDENTVLECGKTKVEGRSPLSQQQRSEFPPVAHREDHAAGGGGRRAAAQPYLDAHRLRPPGGDPVEALARGGDPLPVETQTRGTFGPRDSVGNEEIVGAQPGVKCRAQHSQARDEEPDATPSIRDHHLPVPCPSEGTPARNTVASP